MYFLLKNVFDVDVKDAVLDLSPFSGKAAGGGQLYIKYNSFANFIPDLVPPMTVWYIDSSGNVITQQRVMKRWKKGDFEFIDRVPEKATGIVIGWEKEGNSRPRGQGCMGHSAILQKVSYSGNVLLRDHEITSWCGFPEAEKDVRLSLRPEDV